MTHSNPQGDFVQFILGGALASGGAYALMNQVFLGSGFRSVPRYPYGGYTLPFGTPGMGLLMIPLGIGVVMLFLDGYRRFSQVLIWGSAAALLVGVLNSLQMRMTTITLWQLVAEIIMIAAGAGLMFRSLKGYEDKDQDRNRGSR
jgi:hypothetical protein